MGSGPALGCLGHPGARACEGEFKPEYIAGIRCMLDAHPTPMRLDREFAEREAQPWSVTSLSAESGVGLGVLFENIRMLLDCDRATVVCNVNADEVIYGGGTQGDLSVFVPGSPNGIGDQVGEDATY